MKNLFTNLMKNTAKRTQNTRGGASHEKSSAVAVWNDSRTTVNRRSNDGQSQRRYNVGLWKYAAMITLLLTLVCGNVWATDYEADPFVSITSTSDTIQIVTTKSTLRFRNVSSKETLSSGAVLYGGAYQTSSNNKTYTINVGSNPTCRKMEAYPYWLVLYSPEAFQAGDSIVVGSGYNSSNNYWVKFMAASSSTYNTNLTGGSSLATPNATDWDKNVDYYYILPANFETSNYIAFQATGGTCYYKYIKFYHVDSGGGGEEKDYTVTAATSTGTNTYGTVSAAASSLDERETTTITATPATGYQVTNWAVSGTGASISPNGASNSNTTTLTMGSENATVTATFGPKSYTVTLDNQSATTAGTESVTTTYAANTNLTAAITCPTKTSKVFAGYFTGTNGTGIQLIDPAGNWIASAGGGSTYTDGSKNWKYDNDLTLYACWMEYCPGMDMAAQAISLGSGEHKTWTGLTTNKILYSVAGNTTFDDSSDASNAYDGLKFKNNGDYILFLVQANSSLKLYFGYTDTKPKISINGGAESTVDVGSTGSKTPNQEVDFGTQTYDRLIKLRTVTSNTVVLQKIEITAPASTYTLTASATVINPMTENTKTGGITATITNSPVSGIISGTSTSTSSNTFTVGGTTVTAPATVAGSSAECDECTYRFDSWENIPATVTADVSTIHAKYNTTYGISYDKDGGSWADAYSAPAYYVYGTGVSLPVAANITKSGYTFNGWDDGSSTIASIGNTAWGNISVTAKWLANPTSLTNGTTTYNSQEVSWTAGSTEAAWEVYVSTSSSTPAVDQSPTATPTSAAYKFRGLEASTTYYWWVRAKYSNTEKSAWVAGTSFTTSSAVRTFESGQKIYFKDASGNISGLDCLWKVSTSSGNVYAYFYDDAATPNEAWSTYGVEVTNSHWNEANAIYEFTVPQLDEVDHTWTGVIFTRGSAPTFVAKDGFFGQQTSNQTPNIGQNLYIQNTNAADGYGKYNGSWSKYAKNPALLGDFNDWNPDANVFENYSSNVGETFFVLDEASTTYDFKIIDGEDWYSYDNSGAGWTITNTNTTAQLLYTNNSGNMHITSTEAGEYMLKYNKSTHNFIAAYYPKERLVRGTIVYFDVRKETNWKSAAFSARYGWQHFDNGSEYSWDIKKNGTALEDWVYYAVVPDCKTIGKVEMKRLNPADEGGTPWCTALVAMASSRTSVLQNCLKEEKDKEDYCNDWTPQWTTYCPPTDEVTLSDNSTTVIAGTSGNGSKSTPYLVETGGTINVTAAADQLVDDDNMTKKFDFEVNKSSEQDDESASFNYSSLSNNTVYKVTVKSYNYYNSTSGTKTVSDTLYYKALNTYTITYNAGTGATGSHADDLKIYGIAKALPGATFEKTGYTQTGWAIEEGGSKAYELSADYTGNDDLDLYPVWTANTYSVTLNTNSGTINSGDVTSYTYGVGATLPTDVTRDHYRFAGWYDAEDLDVSGDEVEEIADDATDDKEYWAKWTPLYAITDGEPSNGSIAITDGSSAITEAAAGDAVYIVATPSSGYEFSEWSIYKTSDSKTTVSPAAATASTSFTMPAYAVTVDASFVVETYTLSYSIGTGATGSASGGTSAGSYAEGTTITVPAKGTLANTGYTFRGWSDGTTFYLAGQSFSMPASNVTLTAVWDGNGSSVTLTHFGTQFKTSAPRRGFAYAGSLSGTKYIIESDDSNTKNADNDSSAIRLHYSGKYLKVLGPGATTTLSDSLFTGVTQVSFKWQYIASTTTYTTGIDVYVGSTKVETKSLTGNKNDDYATATISNIASKNGTVKLVNTGTTSSNQKFNFDDITITCGVLPTGKTVTFACGSTEPSTSVSGMPSKIEGITSGLKIVKPADPSASGYIFGGWYSNAACTAGNEIDWSTTITADKTIYAKWTAKTSPGSGTVSGTTSICSGSNTNVTLSTSVSGASYKLYKDEDEVADSEKAGTGSALTWNVSDEGTYTVSAVETETHASGDMSGSATISIYTALSLTDSPTTPRSAGVGVGCALTGLTTTGNANVAYKWQVCDKDDASGTNTDITSGSQYADYTTATMTFTPASSGTYYFRCVVSDDCGDSYNSSVVTVVAKVAPNVYELSGTTSICEGETTDITLGNSQTGVVYKLLKDGVDQSDNKTGDGDALTWTVSDEGTYTIQTKEDATYAEVDMDGSAVISYYTATAIGTQPTTTVSQHDGLEFTLGTGLVATGGGDLSYQWYSYTSSGGAGEAEVDGADEATYTTSKTAGTYYYKVEVTATCGSVKSEMITVTVDNKHYLTYDANNGSGAPSGSYLASGSTTLSSTMPTRSGYIFLGWNTKDDGTGDMYQPGASFTMPSTATTLYATWASPCFQFKVGTAKAGSGWDVADNGSITTALWTGSPVLSGGTMTNTSGTSLAANNSYGIVMVKNSREITLTLTGGQFQEGTVIELEGYTNKNSTSHTYGFAVSGNAAGSPITESTNAYVAISQRYVVRASDGIEGTSTCTITMNADASGSQTYLSAIKIGGCFSCTSISPSLSYDKTTIWVGESGATPTLNKDGSTGAVTYASSNMDAATVNESTGVVTAVAHGTTTITATIAADGTHCGKTLSSTITVKEMGCEYVEIAGATRKASAAAVNTYTGALYKEAVFNTDNTGKISGGKYVYLVLKSGHYFQNGDTVAITITTKSDQGTNELNVCAGGKIPGTCVGVISSDKVVENAVNKVVLSNVPSNTDTITVHRTGNSTTQNPFVQAISVYRYGCADVYYFNDESTSGEWSDEENWLGPAGQGGGLPTIDDRIVINKPMTVDVTNAKAKEIILDQSGDGKAGKLTIGAGQALVVAGTIKTYDGSSYSATTPSDIVLESDDTHGTGALITGERSTTTQATVGFYTQAIKHATRGYVNQYIGIPFSGITAYDRFYDTYVYEYIASSNAWSPLTNNGEMSPYTAYNLMRDEDTETTLYSGGTLVLPGTAAENKDHDLTLTLRNASATTTNMFANPYTAPIDITAMVEGDFTGVDATIYLFNSGSKDDVDKRGAQAGAGAGQWLVLPVASVAAAAPGSYAVTTIPSQQAFMVKGNSDNATHKVTLDYKKHVYDPAMTSGATINPARAPKRVSEETTLETMNLTVQGLGGASDRVLMFMREDFSIGFDNGWDGRKMKGKTYAPYLYAATDDGKMAVNSIPTAEGTVLGFKAGTEDNFYTFSFEYDGEDNWYLNDLKEQKSTLIHAAETYEFVAEPGDTETRFVISATPIHKITTGNESASTEAAKVRKLIIDDKIYIIRGGRMYSVDGQMIK